MLIDLHGCVELLISPMNRRCFGLEMTARCSRLVLRSVDLISIILCGPRAMEFGIRITGTKLALRCIAMQAVRNGGTHCPEAHVT